MVRDRFEKLARKAGLEEYVPYIMEYMTEIVNLQLQYAYLFMDKRTALAMQNDLSWSNMYWFAVSSISTDHSSCMANHQDKPSALPAIILGSNPCPSRVYTGGDLIFTNGAFRMKYGAHDVVMVNGNNIHAVLPVCPAQGAKKCAKRHSMVHFCRGWEVVDKHN